MAYNTSTYFLFLIIIAALYMLTPKKYRYIILLSGSLFFAFSFSKFLIGWMILAGFISWAGGLMIEKAVSAEKGLKGDEKKKAKARAKQVMLLPLTGLVSILVGLKYTNFIVTEFMRAFGNGPSLTGLRSLAGPIGIYFYTLQAVSYILDIYWKREKADGFIIN